MYSPYLPISPLATRSFVQVPVASPAIGFAETPRLVPETPRVERREEPGSPTLSPKPQTQKRVVDEDTQPEPVKRARKEDRDSGASEERAKEPSSLPKPSSSLSQGSKQLSKPLSQNSEEQSNPKDNDKDSQSQLDPKAAATTNTAPDHGPAVDSPSGSASPTFSQKLSALLDPTIPAQPIPEKAAAPEFDIAALLASIAKPESQKDEFARYAAMVGLSFAAQAHS